MLVRRVGVVLKHRRAARAERAVEEELDGLHGEAAVVLGQLGRRWGGDLLAEVVAVGQHHRVRADREGAIVDGLLQQRDLLEADAGVVDRRQPVVRERAEREVERLDVLRLGRARDVIGHERHRRVGEDARRLSRLWVPHDPAALWVARRQRRHELKRRAVAPRRVPIDAAEPDRRRGEGAVEVGARREGLAGEALLVPAKALQPRALRDRVLGDVRLEHLDNVGGRGAVIQLRPRQLEAAVQQVQVRVDQAGHHHGATQIDERGRGAARRLDRGEVAHLEELAIGDAPGLGGGGGRHRVHGGGVEEELCSASVFQRGHSVVTARSRRATRSCRDLRRGEAEEGGEGGQHVERSWDCGAVRRR